MTNENSLVNSKRHHAKTSEARGTIECPICGGIGQLKKRATKFGYVFWQVDHYNISNNHSSGYKNCCYINKKMADSFGLLTGKRKLFG